MANTTTMLDINVLISQSANIKAGTVVDRAMISAAFNYLKVLSGGKAVKLTFRKAAKLENGFVGVDLEDKNTFVTDLHPHHVNEAYVLELTERDNPSVVCGKIAIVVDQQVIHEILGHCADEERTFQMADPNNWFGTTAAQCDCANAQASAANTASVTPVVNTVQNKAATTQSTTAKTSTTPSTTK